VFEADGAGETRARLRLSDRTSSSKEPVAVRNIFQDIDACLIFQRYDESWRTSLKTNNLIEW
jgi:hypothetical protein